jgi:hypothetical protein
MSLAALSAPSASPSSRPAAPRPSLRLTADPADQRVSHPSAVQPCHKGTLHCIFECLGAADWLAALLPVRSWLSAGLRQLRPSSATSSWS